MKLKISMNFERSLYDSLSEEWDMAWQLKSASLVGGGGNVSWEWMTLHNKSYKHHIDNVQMIFIGGVWGRSPPKPKGLRP